MDLSKLKASNNVKVDDNDSLGGGYILESGIYPMTIELAYMDQSAKGALSLNCVFKHGNQTLKQSFWVQSGNDKGNAITYKDKRTGEEHLLPGLNMANAIIGLTLGKELSDLDTTEKMVNIYNFEAKAEIPTKVEVLMDLLGQDIIVGVQKRLVDKTVKADNGMYVPAPDGSHRTENEVSKVFQAGTGLTVAELRAGESTGSFIQDWKDKWTDVTIDKRTKQAGGAAAPVAGAPTPAPAAGSLFPS